MSTSTNDAVYDDRGFRIHVGTRVRLNDPDVRDDWGTVTGFTDWDIDDRDERHVYDVSPSVRVRFDDGAVEFFRTTIEFYGDYDGGAELLVEEVAVYR